MAEAPEPSTSPPAGRVCRVDGARLEEAVRVLVRGDAAAASRFLAHARSNRISLDHLWAFLDDRDRIRATVLVAPGTGRTAMVFASRAGSTAMIDVLGDLVRRAIEGLDGAGIDLAQALVDPTDTREEAIFLAGGFSRMAELDYLERPIPRFGSIPAPDLPAGVTIEPWDGEDRKLLEDLLERTYEHTLDCPGLSRLRRTSDILDGHMATGVRIPEWWHVLRVDGRPAGVLLFNRGSDGHTIELVYLGLDTESRGRGLARTLLTFGLSLLNDDPARLVVLAVDRANHPATRLYRRAGFRYSVRRLALVRPVGEVEPG